MSNEASTPPSLAPRKRRPPPLNPDNAENERLLRIYNGKRSRADDTATSTPSPNPPPPIPSASNPIPKEKPPPKSQPKPSTSHSRPTVETIEDEDNIRMAQRTKPKNPKTLVIHSDEEDSEIEEVEKPSWE